MAKLYNLARMSTLTTGGGTITLAAPVNSFISFAQAGAQNGDEVTYAIDDGNQREVGRGLYSSAGPTLTRNVLRSTNGNAPIVLDGRAQVSITAAAEDLVGATVTVSPTPPADAGDGDLWWDSSAPDGGRLYIRFDDGNSAQWVAASPSAVGPQGPQGIGGTVALGTVTTGAANENAEITESGTPQNRIFNFKLPRGQQGPPGEVEEAPHDNIAYVRRNTAWEEIQAPVLRGYLAGFTMSAAGQMLTVSAGMCTDAANAVYITGPNFQKSIGGAFVAGSGQAGRGQGVGLSANATLHVFAAIINGVYDVFFDSSATGANAPAGTTARRRVGSIVLDASSQIRPFSQYGDEFLWPVASLDIEYVSASFDTPDQYTVMVPQGLVVNALLIVQFMPFFGNAFSALRLGSPDEDIANIPISLMDPTNLTGGDSITAADWFMMLGMSAPTSAPINIRTNTNRQIQAMVRFTTGNLSIYTRGYIDTRDRLA